MTPAEATAGPAPRPSSRSPPITLVSLLVLGFLNWLFDAAFLFAALAAILPGGGGTIEAIMSAGLMLAGGTGAAVIAAVLLYRMVSAWVLVPLGWGLWRPHKCSTPQRLRAMAR